MPPREGLVDDGRPRRVRPIPIVERPSGQERRRHRPEVTAADFVEVHVAFLCDAAPDNAPVPVGAAERDDQRLGGVADAGYLAESCDDVGERARTRLSRHGGSAEVDRRHEDVRIEAQINSAKIPQGAPEEHGPDHEHDREGDLADDQAAPDRDRIVSIGRRSAAGLERRRRITSSRGQRRAEAEQHAGDEGGRDDEREQAPVRRQIDEDRSGACVQDCHERLADPPREQQPTGPRRDRR